MTQANVGSGGPQGAPSYIVQGIDLERQIGVLFDGAPHGIGLLGPDRTCLGLNRAGGEILDLGLPDMDGLDVLAKIRENHDTPVLILTARGGELARVRGLESGADDYLEKPFSHLELLARANALTRRGRSAEDGAVKAGDLTINMATYTLTRAGEEIQLSGTEWRLLSCLMQNAGKVADNRTLAREVWRSDVIDQDVIKTAMRRLRVKLGTTPADDLIKTHRGIGYSFVPLS